MKTFRPILFVAALFASSLTLRGELATGIQAVVHDSVITFQEVKALAAPSLSVLSKQLANNPEAFREKAHEVLTNSLEELVARQLILHDFKTAGYNLPESIIDEEIKGYIRDRYNNDRRLFIKTLQEDGLTPEKFRKQLREQKIVEYLRWKNSSADIIISPHKIEKYYKAHSKDYMVKDQVKLRMLTLNKNGETNSQLLTLATEIEGKIRAGAGFAEMAQGYSQDSYQQQGGARGWVERGELREAIDEAAFKLRAGETATVETSESIYVLLAEEVKPAHVRPLNEIRDEIEKNLLGFERDRLANEYVNKLRRKTFVTLF